jgi:nucleoside-diphosphate-sugar epimerase
MIVREAKVDSNIIRPLFAYGGIGDMNSLIAKSIYAALEGRQSLDMFLDPTKYKDYLFVDDFCTAVVMAAEQELWDDDFIVAAETPHVTGEIVSMVDTAVKTMIEGYSEKELAGRPPLQRVKDQLTMPSDIVQWHPETDYLGNHRLSSKSFREASGWEPAVSLNTGICGVALDILEGICGGVHYDPLRYLDEANERDIDLTHFY